MPEAPFSNREIQSMFKASDERSDEFRSHLMERMDIFEAKVIPALQEIKTQTTKTNGRVTTLERNIQLVAVAIIIILVLKFPEIYQVLKTVI